MKEIKVKSSIYLEDYDIEVNPYLTYSQIQQIVNAVKTQDSWAVRQQSIDMLMLYHATNINKEQLEEIGHDVLLQSGLIDSVCKCICNMNKVYEGLAYTESTQRALAQIIKELPKLTEPLMKKVVSHSDSSKK